MNIEKIKQIVLGCGNYLFDTVLKNDVTKKGDSDYVTKADVAVQNYLFEALKNEFPHIGFLSEEGIKNTEYSEYWILDPIDGTTNFMHELKMSAVSLGLCSNGEIVMGIIYNPFSNELFWAEKGKGAYLNDEKIECSKHTSLNDCLGLYEFNAYKKNECEEALLYAKKIYLSCQDLRTFGSAALELAYVACGRADVFFGRYLKPWDYAAAVIIISEAGGRIADLDGNLDMTVFEQHIVATNGVVHNEFAELLK